MSSTTSGKRDASMSELMISTADVFSAAERAAAKDPPDPTLRTRSPGLIPVAKRAIDLSISPREIRLATFLTKLNSVPFDVFPLRIRKWCDHTGEMNGAPRPSSRRWSALFGRYRRSLQRLASR
jgi:hypothetical protein